MSGPIDGGYRDVETNRRRLESTSQRVSLDRTMRRNDDVHDVARRDAFRRAVLGLDPRRCAEVRFVRSPTRQTLPTTPSGPDIDSTCAPTAKPCVSVDRLSALLAAEDRRPKANEARRPSKSESGIEGQRNEDQTELSVPWCGREDPTASSSCGGRNDDHAGAGSGRRAFEFAQRFAAFAELRSSAHPGTELELRLDTSFAGEVLVVLSALGDRRVALRARGAGMIGQALDLAALVAEMRDTGLVVVKPTEDDF